MARYFPGSAYLYNTGNPPVTSMPLTISCLFNPDVTNLTRVMVKIEEANGDQWYRLQHQVQKVQGYKRNGGITPIASSSTASITTGNWYNACAVFTSDTSMAAYLNGGDKGTNSTSCTPDSAQINQIAISHPAPYYEGSMAEIGIWNAALTDAEVAILGKFVSPLLVRPQNLVFYLPCIRDNDGDLVGGLSLTVGGSPSITAHSRVFCPSTLKTKSSATVPPPTAGQSFGYIFG